VVAAVELITQEQREQLLLVELVGQEFQVLDQQMQAHQTTEQPIEVVAVEEMVNLHLQVPLKLEVVDLE
jgi:hypothetical protein